MHAQDVPTNHGWLWIKQGFGLFRKSPLMWWVTLGLWLLLVVILLVLLRGIGALIASILYPVLLAGGLVACRDVERRGQLSPAALFAGFRQNFVQLLILGFIVFLAQLVLSLLATLLVPLDEEVANLMQKFPDASEQEIQTVLPKLLVFAGVQVLVKIPVFIAVWFAPALLIFENMKTFPAIRWSVYACVANLGPLLVYLLASAAILLLIGALPILLAAPVMLVAIPTLLASVYTGYRDIFVESPEPGG